MAVCEVFPPTSVTKPAKTLRLKCSMSAGAMSLATITSGSLCGIVPGVGCGLSVSTEGEPRAMVRSIRSTTCSTSALRSRR